MSLALTAFLALGISLAAFLARTLTGPGALAAAGVGWAVLVGTGWIGGAALMAFFVSSSAVSRLTEGRQPAWVDAKGNRRDHWQVLANGGVAAIGGLSGLVNPALGLWIVSSSLAAAAADTWATSLGAFSRGDPWQVLRWTRVPKGASGGVSLIGTLGGVAGASAVAVASMLSCALLSVPCSVPAIQWSVVAALGVLGMLADSVLGATLQARFRCPACDAASERPLHRCGTPTVLTGGIRWLGNDAVNALATAAAGAAGAIGYFFCWS
ncbi:MAG TPA: DUF92 domain-containing protein [Gemmatimonadales bacterium]